MPITPRVSSQLINDYQELQAYSSDILKAVFRNEAGDMELISYSPDESTLYNILPDPESDDGWGRVAIGGAVEISDPKSREHQGEFGSVAACCVAGRVQLVALGSGRQEIKVCERETDSSPWGPWVSYELSSIVEPTTDAQALFVALVAQAGNVELFANIWIDQSTHSLYCGRLQGTDLESLQSVEALYNGSSLICVSSRVWGPGVVYDVPASDDLTRLRFLPAPYSAGAAIDIGEPTNTFYPTAAEAADGYTRLFYDAPYGDEPGVYMVDFGSESPEPEAILEAGQVNSMQAVDADLGADDGAIHLYLADDGWSLWVSRSTPGSSTWEEPVPLGMPVEDLFAGAGADGQGELILDTTNEIFRLWNNSDVASMDDPGYVRVEPILMPAPELATVPTYATKVTLIDENGDRVRGRELTLSAGTVASVGVNHRHYTLSPDRPVSLTTDGAGAITLYSETGGLDVAKLRIADGSGLDHWVVRNDQPVRALRKIDLATFETAFPPPFQENARPTLEAIQQLLALLPERGSVDRSRDPLTPGGMRNEHWRFSAVNEAVSFTALTAEQARRFVDGLPAAGGGVRVLGGGFWESLGELLRAAEDEVKKTFDLVVSTVAEGLHVAVQLVVGGITYVFTALVGYANEVMGLLDALWTIAKAALVNLVALLGWDPVTYLDETWAAKKVLEKSMLSTFGSIRTWLNQNGSQLPEAPSYSSSQFQANLDSVQGIVKDRVFGNPLAESSRLAHTPGSGVEGGVAQAIADSIHAQEVVLEWLLHKITGPLATFRLAVDLGDLPQFAALQNDLEAVQTRMRNLDDSGQIRAKIETLSKTLDIFRSKSAIEGVQVAEVLSNLQPLMTELLAEIPSLAPSLISTMEGFLEGVLDNDLLTTPLSDCRLLQKVSDLFNPGRSQPLTFVGLGALLCAVPATAFFQLEYGRGPFGPADWERAKEAENPLLHLRLTARSDSGSDPLLGVAVTAAVLSAIWVAVDAGINAASLIWADNPVRVMVFPAVMLPAGILTLVGVELGVVSGEWPSNLVGILWTDYVLLWLPLIVWLLLGALSWAFFEIVPVFSTLGPILGSVIGALQIPFAIAAIALEYEHHKGSFLGVLLHLGTPTDNFIQAVGLIPGISVFVVIYGSFVDMLNLDGTIVWSVESAGDEGSARLAPT